MSSLVILAASVLSYRAEKTDTQTNSGENPPPTLPSARVTIVSGNQGRHHWRDFGGYVPHLRQRAFMRFMPIRCTSLRARHDPCRFV